ncbi:MAG: portal protein [Candidatus Pelagibacter sp. TMED203]|nr:MAG: portal protein [Candidatus Pelagibacter sp. TMED203]
MAELFGYEINRKKEAAKGKSFVAPSDEEGTLDIAGGAGFFSQYVNLDKSAKNDWDLIRKYRTTSEAPECDQAIEDIVNESITADETDSSVKLDLDQVELSKSIKGKISTEFDEVLRLLEWKHRAHDIFRRWYVDGRLFYHKMIDEKQTRKGITELRYIDPKFIKKVRLVEKDKGERAEGIDLVKRVQEFYIYNEAGVYPGLTGIGGPGVKNSQGLKVSPDSIAYCTSGIFNPTTKQVYGYLHKAIKPTNQLRMMEDATVIYRISRAPERRIFYIDVGNLPKPKAEAYLKDVMSRYRNKVVYDGSTGEVKDDRNQMSMLEDFWLPRREGGRGTEITTLPAGQNLGEMDDVQYFQEKLYKSLNIPISRLQSDSGFNMGRSAEITRDEIKFTKFIQRLRKRFSLLFQDLLKTQCVLKGIMTAEDWEDMKEDIIFDFNDDNHFFELKDAELLESRINQLNAVTEYVGTYYSIEWVRKNILKQTQEEMSRIDKQIEDEKNSGQVDPEAGRDMGGPEGGFGDPSRGVEQEPDYEDDDEPEDEAA